MMNNSNDLINLIKKISFFSEVPDEKLEELIPYFKEVKLKADEILFYQGDDSLSLYILIEGQLQPELSTAVQEKIVVGSVNPLETVGELGVLSGEPRSMTVKAVVDSVILQLSSKVFKKFCYEYPGLLTKISELIVNRSLQLVKLISKEEKRQVIIIFPILTHSLLLSFEQKLHEMFSHSSSIFFTNPQKEAIEKLLKPAQAERKKIAVFLKSWDANLFNFLSDKLSHFYVVVESEQHSDFDAETKKIIADVEQIDNARLELILLQPENIQRPQNTKKWLERATFDLHHHLKIENKKMWHRLLQFMTGKATALVLGGGGLKGFSHLGVIAAMEEKDIPIDAIGGSSSGALIAACYAIGFNHKQILKYFDEFRRVMKKVNLLRSLTWPFISLFSAKYITNRIRSVAADIQVEDLWTPYFALSSSLLDGKEIIHKTGPLWKAVRSSIAAPGLIPPMMKKGDLLFDGGLLNNLPVDTMRSVIGNDHTIIASQLTPPKELENQKGKFNSPPILPLGRALLLRLKMGHQYTFPPFFQTFFNALLLGARTKERKNSLAADVLVAPDLYKFATFTSLKKEEVPQIIEIGYQTAMSAFKNAQGREE